MAAPRRVLSLATLYPNPVRPAFGTFVARSLEALAARGDWEVTVINPLGMPTVPFGQYREIADLPSLAVEGGIDVHRPRFTLVPKLGGRWNPALIARAVLPLAQRLHRATPFDLIDAQFFYPDGPAAARVAASLGLPLSIKARGADIHYWGQRGFARRRMLSAASQARGLLAVSDALRRDMIAVGMQPEKISVHYTGLDRQLFEVTERSQARAQLAENAGLHVATSGKLLVTVGALTPRKGQRLALRALAMLPDAVLKVVGTGPDEGDLRRLAAELGLSDRVQFPGSVPHEQLATILSAADAMVLPSASEGLANAWIEALACGTPIVISDVGGARELLDTPVAGRLAARNPDAIAQAVGEIFADPQPQEAVAATVTRFSWEANAAALARHYDGLLGGGRSLP
ncbi:glycosyltransferase [Novosphingobium tardum]|uniref:Glycosyltransferase n=1 Tax=Novosphingobium tardum TaxID=1538021 RepID=A0ABV8RNR8_9SPHN